MKKKVLDFYRNSLPEGVTIGIDNYFDDRKSQYDRCEFSSEQELLEKRNSATNNSSAIGAFGEGSGSLFGVAVSAEAGYEKQSSAKSHSRLVATRKSL